MEDIGIFYEHLVHFTIFCYVLWTLGKNRGNLAYFSRFGIFVPRKIWQPCSKVKYVALGSTNGHLEGEL
jgi:hypothetical protein